MIITQKETRAAASTAMAKDIPQSDPESVASDEDEMEDNENLYIKKRNGSSDPSNCHQATRTRNIRTKETMLVPL